MSEDAIVRFCNVLSAELSPWGKRLGRTIAAVPAVKLAASPWRGVRISSNAAQSKVSTA